MSFETGPSTADRLIDRFGWLENEFWTPGLYLGTAAYFALLVAGSLVFYPLAWLLGFRPAKWWSDTLPEWFVGIAAIVALPFVFAGIPISLAFRLFQLLDLLSSL